MLGTSVQLVVGAGGEPRPPPLVFTGRKPILRISAPVDLRCPISGTSWCEPEQQCKWAADGCGGGIAEDEGEEEGELMSEEEEDYELVESEVEDAATAAAAAAATAAAAPPAETGAFRRATSRSRAGARPGAFVPLTPCSKPGGCSSSLTGLLPNALPEPGEARATIGHSVHPFLQTHAHPHANHLASCASPSTTPPILPILAPCRSPWARAR